MNTTALVEEAEPSEITRSVAELSRLEPSIDLGILRQLVQQSYEELTPAKVHNYLPILIVHEVRDILHDRQHAQ